LPKHARSPQQSAPLSARSGDNEPSLPSLVSHSCSAVFVRGPQTGNPDKEITSDHRREVHLDLEVGTLSRFTSAWLADPPHHRVEPCARLARCLLWGQKLTFATPAKLYRLVPGTDIALVRLLPCRGAARVYLRVGLGSGVLLLPSLPPHVAATAPINNATTLAIEKAAIAV
jgi:hypothetical protein